MKKRFLINWIYLKAKLWCLNALKMYLQKHFPPLKYYQSEVCFPKQYAKMHRKTRACTFVCFRKAKCCSRVLFEQSLHTDHWLTQHLSVKGSSVLCGFRSFHLRFSRFTECVKPSDSDRWNKLTVRPLEINLKAMRVCSDKKRSVPSRKITLLRHNINSTLICCF